MSMCSLCLCAVLMVHLYIAIIGVQLRYGNAVVNLPTTSIPNDCYIFPRDLLEPVSFCVNICSLFKYVLPKRHRYVYASSCNVDASGLKQTCLHRVSQARLWKALRKPRVYWWWNPAGYMAGDTKTSYKKRGVICIDVCDEQPVKCNIWRIMTMCQNWKLRIFGILAWPIVIRASVILTQRITFDVFSTFVHIWIYIYI